MGQDVNFVAETATITSASGLTLTSGATLSMSSGTFSLAKGNASLGSGGLTIGTGTLQLTGGAQIAGSTPAATISVATASGTSIPVATSILRVSASAATTAGSCTLAAGAIDGQTIFIVNESANSIIITGNIKGTATIAASLGAYYVWVTADTQWIRSSAG